LQAIEKLAAELGPARLVVLEYHRGDGLSTGETNAMFTTYGVTGTPTIFFNGSNRIIGGGSDQYLYNAYKTVVTRLISPSLISLAATSSSNNGVLTVNVTLTNLSGQTLEGTKLVGVAYHDLGAKELRFVVWDITSPVIVAALASGATFGFQLTGVGSKMVVLLETTSGQIIQVALAV
jgi:hypothetical protein